MPTARPPAGAWTRPAGKCRRRLQRQRQLHDTEVGSQVPTGGRDFVDQEVADLAGQFIELRLRQVL